jgi:tyrosyl-tRNA synthetase
VSKLFCWDRENGSERVHLPKLIADEFGLSTSEARRLINQGAVKVGGDPALDFDPLKSFLAGKTLSVGKKRSVRL